MLCIVWELSDQVKFELAHIVVTGVVVPHSCKYLSDRPKLLFHRPLLDEPPSCCQITDTRAIGKDLEERYVIGDDLYIRLDLQPTEELAPLAPCGGVFLEDFG